MHINKNEWKLSKTFFYKTLSVSFKPRFHKYPKLGPETKYAGMVINHVYINIMPTGLHLLEK